MLIGPQGPPWWIFFQNFFKNVLVYPQLTQKYVLWHSKLEKSILGRRELNVIERKYKRQIFMPDPIILATHRNCQHKQWLEFLVTTVIKQ